MTVANLLDQLRALFPPAEHQRTWAVAVPKIREQLSVLESLAYEFRVPIANFDWCHSELLRGARILAGEADGDKDERLSTNQRRILMIEAVQKLKAHSCFGPYLHEVVEQG